MYPWKELLFATPDDIPVILAVEDGTPIYLPPAVGSFVSQSKNESAVPAKLFHGSASLFLKPLIGRTDIPAAAEKSVTLHV